MLHPDYTFRLRAGRLASALLLALALALGAGCQPAEAPPKSPPVAYCTEDMACWDCATMGNHRCWHHSHHVQ